MRHEILTSIIKVLLLLSLFTVIRPSATYLNEKINPKIAQRISRLGNSFRELPANAMIIVDGDNVRGKTKFSASKEQLCKDLDTLVISTGIDNRVVLMYDHGNEHEAFIFGSLAVCFSGPGRTADDVIARDVVWFQRRFNCPIVVVTADTGLKTRCYQGGRITGQLVTIIDSTLFVELLGSTIANTPVENRAPSAAYSDISNKGVPMNEDKPQAILSVEAMRPFTTERMNVLRRELGVRNQIRSIEKFVKGGCGKKKMGKLQKRAAELDARLKKVISAESVSLGATLEDAMKMSPEFQEAGYNALISMLRAGSTRGREETWERVLLAERFRNTLLATTLATAYQSQTDNNVHVSAAVDLNSNSIIETNKSVEDIITNIPKNNLSFENEDIENSNNKRETILSERPLEIYCDEINKNFSRTNNTAELIRWIKSKENVTINDAIPDSIPLSVSVDVNSIKLEDKNDNFIQVESDTQNNLISVIETVENINNNDDEINSIFLIKIINPPYKGFKENMNDPLESSEIEEKIKYDFENIDSEISLKLSPIHEQILIQQKRIKYELELEAMKRGNMTDEERSAHVRTPRALSIMQKSLQGPRTSHNVPFHVNAEGSRIYELENLSRSPKGLNKKEKIVSRKDLIGGGIRYGSERAREIENITVDEEIAVVDGVNISTNTKDDVSTSLRIVCVSDTHGMENVFTGSVPDGDIFIHSGDFAADKGKSRLKIKQLDEWMSTLPHMLKIVVRGNHDPLGGNFPISKAIYAERSTNILYRGINIGLIPHGAINIPNGSNIIISHEPPYGVLDQALGRKKPHVGSHYLAKSVMKNIEKPQLWIFGHIHEGFGAVRTTFGSKGLTTHKMGQPIFSSTLCINAASANPGPAHSIDNLPIIIDIKTISNVINNIEDENEMIENML